MSLKRFLVVMLITAVCFLAGVAVGRFVMPRKIEVTVIDIKDLADVIERYNEMKYEIEKIKEWNKEAIVEPEPEEGESEKNN